MTNSPELRAAIARAGESYTNLAKILGISTAGLYNKVSGTTEFKASEIKKLREQLCLGDEDVERIFFSEDVN